MKRDSGDNTKLEEIKQALSDTYKYQRDYFYDACVWLIEQNEQLTRALEFYAEPDNWEESGDPFVNAGRFIKEDSPGTRAREALGNDSL